jgi:hypothetical protein
MSNLPSSHSIMTATLTTGFVIEFFRIAAAVRGFSDPKVSK